MMGVKSPIPNQNLFQSNQNFSIDIETLYSDFIQEIDAARSIANTQVNVNLLNVLDVSTIARINSLLQTQDTPQESRTHAFFRLIGFPVISQDFKFFNPGYDNITGTKKITLEQKISIINSPINGFRALSLQRENNAIRFAKIFSAVPTTITSTVLSLTSSLNVRKFGIPVTNNDPFDTSVANQSYTASLKSIIGTNNQVTLNQYQDANGNKPDASTLSKTRYHIVKPYIVDGRIDVSVNPASRKVAVPFVPNKLNTLISENTYVKRPLLEKVIIDRFGQQQDTVVSPAQQEVLGYILNVPTVKNDALIQQAINQNSNNPSVQLAFDKYIFMIQAMCTKLVEAQLKIQIVQRGYYWLPLPSTTGPEGGSLISDPIISQTLPDGPNFSFITTSDRDVINATLLQTLDSNSNPQIKTLNGDPNPGPFALDFFNSTFDTDTTTSFGNLASQELDRLLKTRTRDMSVAADALRTIEIIMGEWSGLGLCDIIAVIGALYTMPLDSLVSFLDLDAFDRMLVKLNLQNNPPATTDISTAHHDFINSVQVMYNLMDDIYQNLATSNSINA